MRIHSAHQALYEIQQAIEHPHEHLKLLLERLRVRLRQHATPRHAETSGTTNDTNLRQVRRGLDMRGTPRSAVAMATARGLACRATCRPVRIGYTCSRSARGRVWSVRDVGNQWRLWSASRAPCCWNARIAETDGPGRQRSRTDDGLGHSRSQARRAPEASEAGAAGAVLAGDESEWAGYSPVPSIEAQWAAWRSGRVMPPTT
jgi:hypothetical protein